MRKFFMLALLACCWLGTNSSARSEICNIGAGIGATHEFFPFQGCVYQSPVYNVEVGDVLGMTKAPILWDAADTGIRLSEEDPAMVVLDIAIKLVENAFGKTSAGGSLE